MENKTGTKLQGPPQPATQLSGKSVIQPNIAPNTGIGLEAFKRFIKGGASGFLAGALLQPLQVIKTSMQISVQEQEKYLEKTLRPTKITGKENGKQMLSLTAREATKFIYRKEGLTGFMRGFTPSVLKNVLNSGSYFSMLYYLETIIRKTGLFNDSSIHFLSSAASRTFQSIISNPIIVVKTRFEVIGFVEYSGTMDAFRQII